MNYCAHKEKRYLLLVVIIVFTTILQACKVTFVPSYDASITEQVDKTAKQINKFYLSMLETTSSDAGGRQFSNFIEEYVEIEVELTSLLNKNRARPLNENSTRICEITLQLWQKYKKEHKEDNDLSNGIIKLNRASFNDLLYAMGVAEKAKGLINNPPQ